MSDSISIALTEAEAKKVAQKRKSDSELPGLYYRDIGGERKISRDAEAFLILEDLGFKDAISDAVKAVLTDDKGSLDLELFEEASKSEADDVNECIAAAASSVKALNELKVKLQGTKFAGIPEISRMFTDVMDSANTTDFKLRIGQYRGIYLSKLDTRHRPGARDEMSDKQAKSDAALVTKY